MIYVEVKNICVPYGVARNVYVLHTPCYPVRNTYINALRLKALINKQNSTLSNHLFEGNINQEPGFFLSLKIINTHLI